LFGKVLVVTVGKIYRWKNELLFFGLITASKVEVAGENRLKVILVSFLENVCSNRQMGRPLADGVNSDSHVLVCC
jgi:hypothetical protein